MMRRLLGATLGWFLVALGVVLYPLPGPGLLVAAIGVALLSRYSPWAAGKLAPVRRRAWRDTRRSVATGRRTFVSVSIAALLGLSGVVWILEPTQPTWWGLPDSWWLPGGFWAGVGQVVSGLIAVVILLEARRRIGQYSAALDGAERAVRRT